MIDCEISAGEKCALHASAEFIRRWFAGGVLPCKARFASNYRTLQAHAWPSRHRLKRRKKAPKVPHRNGHHTLPTRHNPIQRDSNGRRRRAPKGTRVELVFGNSEGERLVLRAGGQVYLNHGLQNRSLYCEAISENQSTPNTHAWPSRHRLTSPRSTKKSNRKFGCFWRCVGDSNP